MPDKFVPVVIALGDQLCNKYPYDELELQRSAKKYANLAKQDPTRARQNR